MKVIFVGGTCEFCQGFAKNFPSMYQHSATEDLVKGRHYTVVKQFKLKVPWPPGMGVGYRLAEYELPEGWGHCSCMFREIDGDAESWKKMMERNRPKAKPRELEPA